MILKARGASQDQPAFLAVRLADNPVAVAGPTNPPVAIAGLFVGGALYTGVFGALELAGVLWLERMAEREPRNCGYAGL